LNPDIANLLNVKQNEAGKNSMAITFEYLALKHQNKLNTYLKLMYQTSRHLAKGSLAKIHKANLTFNALAKHQLQEIQRDRELLNKIFIGSVRTTDPEGPVIILKSKDKDKRIVGTEHFMDNWQAITNDQFVLNCASGYKLEFTTIPPTGCHSPNNTFSGSKEQEGILDLEIQELLTKQAIIPVEKSDNQFVSRLFAVPKKGNSWRAVLNLKPLNTFVAKHHFKIENWWSLRALLQPGDYMVRLDLKDAFLSIPIHPDFVKFLCFDWKGQRYAWQRLPFGLTSSPRIFTKVCKPIVAFLRQQGIKLCIYLDDILLWHAKIKVLKEQLESVMSLLQNLGFKINLEKSELTPSLIINYLGFKINLADFKLQLTDEKKKGIIDTLKELRSQEYLSSRQLASILGKLSAASQSLLVAPLYFRRLQNIQRKLLTSQGEPNYSNQTLVQGLLAEELDWWISNFENIRPAPIMFPPVVLTIYTDSSVLGWGAHSNGTSIQGRWTTDLQKEHINYLELLAIRNGLFAFAKNLHDSSIQIYSDNSSAVAVLRKLGSVRSHKLNQLALEIWEWAISRNLMILALHIPGKSNVLADAASRFFSDRNSWKLFDKFFNVLEQKWGPHDIDMFADSFNHQLPSYVSWKPDPGSVAVDAFTLDWKKFKNVYVFPPFGLIARVIQQVRMQGTQVTLVFPLWPTQPWFPVLQELMVESPYIFPDHQNLLLDAQGNKHPLLLESSLRLAACRIDGSG
jgi:hypothetical protein